MNQARQRIARYVGLGVAVRKQTEHKRVTMFPLMEADKDATVNVLVTTDECQASITLKIAENAEEAARIVKIVPRPESERVAWEREQERKRKIARARPMVERNPVVIVPNEGSTRRSDGPMSGEEIERQKRDEEARGRVSVQVQALGGYIWLYDGLQLGETEAASFRGLGARVTYGFTRLLSFEAELIGARTGSDARFDDVSFNDVDGDLVRSVPSRASDRGSPWLRMEAVSVRAGESSLVAREHKLQIAAHLRRTVI